MKKNVLTLFLLLALCLAVAPGVWSAPRGWPAKLNFGVIPTDSSVNMTERFDSLVKYLEKRLNVQVELKTATDYAAVITGMQFKHIEFAYFGPKSYVEAATRANADAFALEVTVDGSKGYHGVIITRKGTGLNTIQDLKGKTWAFTDPNSTSGTLVPMVYFLQELKIDPDKYFSKVIYSGSHEASMLSVKNGRIDGASTNDLDMARGNGKEWNQEKDFNIIWKSPLIPGSLIAYRKDLPASLKRALKDAFLAYNDPEGLGRLKLKGYTDVTDEMYNPIRNMITVQKQLKK